MPKCSFTIIWGGAGEDFIADVYLFTTDKGKRDSYVQILSL